MKLLHILYSLPLFFALVSCSSNEEPDYPVFMQLASIQSVNANANNQTFEYDDYGRIVSWSCIANNPNNPASYSAHYSYPDENTIIVKAEEFLPIHHRIFEESIQLKDGRASKSEGTFIDTIVTEDGTSEIRKTYRLLFNYLPTNHLNTVEHLEVLGIGNDIKDNSWEHAWKWMNYLIWEDGNLLEFQDYQGNSTLWQSTKYEYSDERVSYPVIIPMVINNAHLLPLFMQGVFGSNSINLVKSASTFDNNANLTISRQYSYEFEEERISKYTETIFSNSVFSTPVTYTVTWTAK